MLSPILGTSSKLLYEREELPSLQAKIKEKREKSDVGSQHIRKASVPQGTEDQQVVLQIILRDFSQPSEGT